MASNVVDLSAVSEIIRDEPWQLHFWELTPREFSEQIANPRSFISKIGIHLPAECNIILEVVNSDWIADRTEGLAKDDGVVVCNVGGGNTAIASYRITSYGHMKEEVGKHEKTLLHSPTEKKVKGT
jgi:hypothetical protein